MAGRVLFGSPSDSTERTIADLLRTERAGGVMLLLGAVVALVWANSRWASAYESVSAFSFGPSVLHLHLSVETWAADGLLAIFFFVIGLELKRELRVGELSNPATAVVPAVAAVGGMVVPALIYVGVNLSRGGSLSGWAVPTATDIAFAMAVLAIVGRGLPTALRAFLLTLAVVDDLLAILVIAIFFTADVSLPWLAASAVCVFVFGMLARRGFTRWWALGPLAVVAWATMHASGVHATIAGVTLQQRGKDQRGGVELALAQQHRALLEHVGDGVDLDGRGAHHHGPPRAQHVEHRARDDRAREAQREADPAERHVVIALHHMRDGPLQRGRRDSLDD